MTSTLPSRDRFKTKTNWPLVKETDDFWYTALTSTPPPSFTPGKNIIFHSTFSRLNTAKV